MIARELAGTGPSGAGLRILLVESGGRASDDGAQRLATIRESDSDLDPHGETRWRQLGGTAHIWHRSADRWARYLPLTPLDFEQREWVPDSGWPFAAEELARYLPRALAACGVPEPSYSARDWESAEAPRLPLDPSRFETAIELFGPPEQFTERYPAELAAAPGVTLLTNATAVALDEDEGGPAVRRARLACLGGARHAVTARRFVLAAGAIENARLLLLSNARQEAGIGNARDRVGRYLMEHAKVHAGILTAADPALMDRAGLYDVREVRGSQVGAKLALSAAAQRGERLLASATRLIRGGGIRWSRVPAGEPAFDVEVQTELVPDATNRLALSARERDELGLPLASLRWRWSERELASVRRTEELLAEELARAGVGHLDVPPPEAPPRADLAELAPDGHDAHAPRPGARRGGRDGPRARRAEPLDHRRVGVPHGRLREPHADHRRPRAAARRGAAARGAGSRGGDGRRRIGESAVETTPSRSDGATRIGGGERCRRAKK